MNLASVKFISKNELSQLHDKIDHLEAQINTATEFVKEIENGNWDSTIETDSNSSSNLLTESLVSLRNKLKSYSLEEKERNWVTEGLAQFINILRSKNEDVHELTDNIIRNLVKYMGVNQGALFLINDDDPKDVFIEMAACYAYNRKKHLEQRINIGEGLTGQSVLEKSTIYMTQIPQNYVKITSGLGEALPSHLLIVPLKIDEKVFGVVEVASFEAIPKYRIEFVERLGESIASTLANVKNAQKTQQLLKQSQSQTEVMRSQEEEMRQNMEELNATQEEMQRVLKEAQDKETYLNNLINASSDSIMTIDLNYKLVLFNKNIQDILAAQGVSIKKGMEIFELSQKGNVQTEKERYNKVFKGESITLREEYHGMVYETTYKPLPNSAGKIIGALLTSRDISEDVKLQKQTEELLQAEKTRAEEMKAQEEEMMQSMEELSATQDEIERILKEVQDKERYLNELINVPKDSIFTVDKDYKIISANKAMTAGVEGLLGLKDLKGFSVMDFYPDPAEKEKQKAYYDRAFAGENFEIVIEYNHNGAISYYNNNLAPIKNSDGETIAVASFSKDITAMMTAQKQAEQLLEETKQQSEELHQNMEELASTQEEISRVLQDVQEKERYLNELINVPKDSIYTVDKEYKIISANRAMIAGVEGLIGHKDITGFNILDFYPDPVEKEKQKAYYDRAFAGENFEIVLEYNYNGVTSYYSINLAPLKNSEGNITSVASFAKDISAMMIAQKQAEQLLEETKQQSEELHQNMEELSATQEEITRILKEVQDKERYLNELINVPKDSIFTVDKEYKIISANKAMTAGVEAMMGITDLKGFNVLDFYPDGAEKKKQKKYYDRAFAGENFETSIEYTYNGATSYYSINFAPLKDSEGKTIAVASFAKDITATMMAQKQAEQLLEETKQQSEELHQNMEELAATQEEMQRLLTESQQKERYMTELINSCTDSILTVDENMMVINCNNAFKKSYEGYGFEIGKGFDINKLFATEDDKKKYAGYYKRVFKGETLKINEKYSFGDITAHYTIQYSPIKDDEGKVIAAAVFVTDTTELASRNN